MATHICRVAEEPLSEAEVLDLLTQSAAKLTQWRGAVDASEREEWQEHRIQSAWAELQAHVSLHGRETGEHRA
ncbi:hypothetical protein [Leucobacter luti]|nr:hypothetical protein [Leucobacter luti]